MADSNQILSRVGRLLLAGEMQHGAPRSAAVAYALLIQAHSGDGAEVWRSINEALVERWGEKGRERVKKMAWAIHEGCAVQERSRGETDGR